MNNFIETVTLARPEYDLLRAKGRELYEENCNLKKCNYGKVITVRTLNFWHETKQFEYKNSREVQEELINDLSNELERLKNEVHERGLKIQELKKKQFWTVVTFGLCK